MLPILTREQMRAFDQHAITQCDVPGIILMENAGRGAAAVLRQHYSLGRAPMVIVCGGGNNGGDGFVVARQLLSAGVPLAVFTLVAPEGLAGDALVNYRALCGVGCVPILLKGDLSPLLHALAEACVVVDALLGTGISRAVSGIWWEVITALNHAAVPVVALDIPSGLDANTGAVLGVAVRATRTLTFGAYKRGLLQGAAREHVGAIEVIDLGVPTADIVKSVGATASIMTRACLIAALQPRARATHKYRAGNVLVLGGSPGKTGAALLCARAALRAGAGMATIASFAAAATTMQQQLTELMIALLDDGSREDCAASVTRALIKRSAVALGPGMGLGKRAKDVSEQVVAEFVGPVVVDADAITHFAGRPEALKASAGPRILTPHSGELARLLGCSSADVEAERMQAAQDAARRSGAVVLLKGYRTVVAPPAEAPAVCLRGGAVLATAGSGDTLAGIIAALCCHQGVKQAALAGCMWHALAGEHWQRRHGIDRGMLASDLSAQLPAAAAAVMAAAQLDG